MTMTSRTFTVWTNLHLTERALASLQSGLGSHRLVRAAESTTCFQPMGRHDPALAEADIAFGQPEADQCVACARMRWVHLASAGYTTFAGDDIRAQLIARGIPLTNSSSVYDEPCAQHALAFMLAEARQLPGSIRDQTTTHDWNTSPTRAASFLMKGQTVLLVGYGAIAKRLAELLAPFDLHLVGFRRHPRGDEPIEVHAMAELSDWLARADWIIDMLPAAGDTAGFFDGAKFAAMKTGATFINIGRGATVDQPALLAALRGHLRAAYLDVTSPEPLPPEHPLWSAPHCFITPHVAGGHGDECDRLVALFLANLNRHQRGLPLAGRVY
jgi:phosphoglycerate dehydrogenase-like enzyme